MNVYDRHDWQNGELITENLLDNIEEFLGYLSDNAIMHQGGLPDDSDLNDLKANCIYYLYKDRSYANIPNEFAGSDGIIFVTNKENVITQIIYAFKTNSFYRRFTTTAKKEKIWKEWIESRTSDKKIVKELLINNSLNLLSFEEDLYYRTTQMTQNFNGIKYEWDDSDGISCSLSGTTASTDNKDYPGSFSNVFFSRTRFPYGVEPGEEYYLSCEYEGIETQNLTLTSYFFKENKDIGSISFPINEVCAIVIPKEATGMSIRIQIKPTGVVVNGVVKNIQLRKNLTNKELGELSKIENLFYDNFFVYGEREDGKVIWNFNKNKNGCLVMANEIIRDYTCGILDKKISDLGIEVGDEVFFECYDDLKNDYYDFNLCVEIINARKETLETKIISNEACIVEIPEGSNKILVYLVLSRNPEFQDSIIKYQTFYFNIEKIGFYKKPNATNEILMLLIDKLNNKIGKIGEEKDLLDFIKVDGKMVNGIYANYYGEGNFNFSGNYNGSTLTENGNTYIYKKILTEIIPIEKIGLKNGEQLALYYDAEWTERADVVDEIEDIFETSGNIEIVLNFQDESGLSSRQIHTMANRMNIITVPSSVQTLAIYALVSDKGYGPAEVEGQIYNLKLYKNIPNKIEKSSMAFFDKGMTTEDIIITNGLVNINSNRILDFDDDVEYLASVDKNLIPLETVQGIVYNAEDLTISPVKIYGVNHANAGKILYTGKILNLNNKEFYLLANYQTYNIIKDE